MELETDTMGATERVETLLNHEEPDRIPIYLMGIPPYSLTYKQLFEEYEDEFDEWTEDDNNLLLTPLGDYTIRYYLGSEVETKGIGISPDFSAQLAIKTAQGYELADSENHPSIIEVRNAQKEGETYYTVDYHGTIRGHTILPSGDPYSWYVDGFLKKKEDLIAWYDEYGWPHEQPISKFDVQAYEQFKREFGDKIYMIPQLGSCQLYESSWVSMGQARWAYYCRKVPDFIHRLVESKMQAQLNVIEELAKNQPTIIFGGDDMGQKGRPMMSPAMFRKFFFEPFSQVFQKVHDLGAKVFIHSCGNIVELLPALTEAGLDGWQSLEVPSLIDHAAVKKKYGDDFLLVGGIDSSDILCFGSKNDIKQHVHDQILAMGKGGGYIAGPAHDYLNVPLKNALTMRDAIHEFGKYPLS